MVLRCLLEAGRTRRGRLRCRNFFYDYKIRKANLTEKEMSRDAERQEKKQVDEKK